MKRVFGRLGRREDGVTAVIAVISLVGIVGGSMLAIDAGSVWTTRRQIITDTDAAALAAARYIDANGKPACEAALNGAAGSPAGQEAESIIKENDPTAWMEGFTLTPHEDCNTSAGRVRVGARMKANLTFAPVFGINNVEPFSSSTAQYGPLVSTTGMRPVGICDKSPHFMEWAQHMQGGGDWGQPASSHPNYETGHVVHRISYTHGDQGCGVGAGNWAFLDYNGTAPPNGDSMLADWFRNGYPGEVSLGDAETGRMKDCNPEQGGAQDGCDPQTGAQGGGLVGAFEHLRINRTVFPIAVYNKVVDVRDPAGCNSNNLDGSGNNARFCFTAILLVRIWGWSNITGQLNDRSYLDLEFVDQWWQGTIGFHPTDQPTVHGVSLCGGNYSSTIDEKCDV